MVIVGAGFGGLWAARALRGVPAEVILVDRHNYHTFYPLLYQVGAAELNAVDIAFPVRTILRGASNARFLMAEVRGVDPDRQIVRAGDHDLRYDHLILATGSVPHFFGVRGAAEHAFPLREIEQGLALRNHLLTRFERAAALADPIARRACLTFVIVGGGATGVEFAGALAELVRGPLARDYPDLVAGEVSILVLEAADRLLGGMPDGLGRYAERKLARLGVEVRLRARVAEVTPATVELADESAIPAETVVWTAGVRAPPALADWGLATSADGSARVDRTLRVEGLPNVYAVGDAARFEAGGRPLPLVAPVAVQQGAHAGRNVRRALEGLDPLPFRYRDRGMLATIGRNAAVAHVRGLAFRGFPAWVLWLAIHLVKLLGFRNRLVVLTNWAFDYFFFERAVRLILPVREPSPED